MCLFPESLLTKPDGDSIKILHIFSSHVDDLGDYQGWRKQPNLRSAPGGSPLILSGDCKSPKWE